MTTQQTDWIEYTGSDEQIAEMRDAPRGWLVRFDTGKESNVFVSHPQLHVELHNVAAYWIIPDDPLREIKMRQSQTGQPVCIRIVGNAGIHCAYSEYRWTGTHSIWVTTNPDWNIPNAEYSFTSWED